MITSGDIPVQIEGDLKHGVRLEYWTLAWMTSVIVIIALVMGASQAMKTAVIEDVLSLVPAVVFLLSAKWERKKGSPRFPFGFKRLNSLAFLVAAVALFLVGGFLVFESLSALIRREHPTVAAIEIFGEPVWLGWLMIAALIYSAFPPVILGRLKKPVAERLSDKVLHTDALMQKADWQTALAGIAGIVGIGFGLWWADALASLVISASIMKDALSALKSAVAELIDGAPRSLESSDLSCDAQTVERGLLAVYPGSTVRMRESGRYILAEVCGIVPDHPPPSGEEILGADRGWRLAAVTFNLTPLRLTGS